MIMTKFDDKVFIGQKIKYYRKKLNLTQSELAEMVNLSDQHISRIESGFYMPSLKTFFSLVNILKMDLQDFGFNQQVTQNETKNKLINRIAISTESELIFYENLIDATNKSLDKVKSKIL
jgi:transcriptional regulator with XRE-family HTH domain